MLLGILCLSVGNKTLTTFCSFPETEQSLAVVSLAMTPLAKGAVFCLSSLSKDSLTFIEGHLTFDFLKQLPNKIKTQVPSI